MREGLGVWGCESEGGLYVLLESKQRWYSISEGNKKKRKKEHKAPITSLSVKPRNHNKTKQEKN